MYRLGCSKEIKSNSKCCECEDCTVQPTKYQSFHANDNHYVQNTASWLLVESSEKPGGLASTDVTPEGFVSINQVIVNEQNTC